MSDTKQTKGSRTRRAAAGAAVSVLEKEPETVPVLDSFGELDDILGEIAPPAKAAAAESLDDILGDVAGPAKTDEVDEVDALGDILSELAEPAKVEDSLDDILGEIAEPAKADPVDDLEDILGEIAGPAKTAPVDDLDDILGEIAGPAKTDPADSFDDILGEIAPPAKADAADSLDDILSEVAGPATVDSVDGLDDILSELAEPPVPAPSVPKPAGKKSAAKPAPAPEEPVDDLSAMLDEMAPPAPVAEAAAEQPAPEKKKGKAKKLLGLFRPNLKGKREVSRKAYAGMQGAVAVLGLAVIGQGAFIVMQPAHAPAAGHGHAPEVKVTVVPVDYAKVDLERYIGKVRSLSEGGRDMLRHAKVKAAVINLDGGELLYKELRTLAAHSAPADRMTIRDDRVTIASCDGGACGDKIFRLVYDIRHDQAAVCTTQKYGDGTTLSYGYSPQGNSELSHC